MAIKEKTRAYLLLTIVPTHTLHNVQYKTFNKHFGGARNWYITDDTSTSNQKLQHAGYKNVHIVLFSNIQIISTKTSSFWETPSLFPKENIKKVNTYENIQRPLVIHTNKHHPMAYFWVQLRAVVSYLARSVLYMWAISGTSGSSGFGSVSNEQIESRTWIALELVFLQRIHAFGEAIDSEKIITQIIDKKQQKPK